MNPHAARPRLGVPQQLTDRVVLTRERFCTSRQSSAAIKSSPDCLRLVALPSRRVRPLAVNSSDMTMLVRAAVLFCSVAFAPIAAAVGQVEPAAVLVERCRGFSDDRESVAARLCDSYIRGYLAGARSTGSLNLTSEKGPQETFSERAWRTRLGRATRSPRPQYCLPDGTSMHKLVEQLIAYADARASLESMSAQHLLDWMLRAAYPCSRAQR